jgi:hypothetical protein
VVVAIAVVSGARVDTTLVGGVVRGGRVVAAAGVVGATVGAATVDGVVNAGAAVGAGVAVATWSSRVHPATSASAASEAATTGVDRM